MEGGGVNASAHFQGLFHSVNQTTSGRIPKRRESGISARYEQSVLTAGPGEAAQGSMAHGRMRGTRTELCPHGGRHSAFSRKDIRHRRGLQDTVLGETSQSRSTDAV